jgi:hypothetical protein
MAAEGDESAVISTLYLTTGQAMYAYASEPGADFSRVCAHLMIVRTFLLTHPPPLNSRISSPETIHPDACVAIAQLRCLLLLRGRIGAQPQRDVGWLHRLPHHAHQVVVQRLKVRLVSEFDGEGF